MTEQGTGQQGNLAKYLIKDVLNLGVSYDNAFASWLTIFKILNNYNIY